MDSLCLISSSTSSAAAKRDSLLRLLVYNDASEYTGHERMALEGLKALLTSGEYALSFLCTQSNKKFLGALEKLAASYPQRLAVLPMAFEASSFQGARNRYCPRSLQEVEHLIRGLKPQAMLALQANIEQSSAGVYIARRMGLPVISYLALPHSFREMGFRCARLRDFFNRYLYALPDAYLSLSDAACKKIKAKALKTPVAVVPNAIDIHQVKHVDKSEARRRLGLPLHSKIIGMIGRIDFRQKRQDFCLQALEAHWELFAGCHFCVVGEGPDRERLQSRVSRSSWAKHFTWIPWMEGLDEVYSSLDVLAIPSRYEGVPLVMLEAMAYELPIVASRRDAMAELLPEDQLFPYGDKKLFVEKLVHSLEAPNLELLLKLRQVVQEKYSLGLFRRCFLTQLSKSFAEVVPIPK